MGTVMGDARHSATGKWRGILTTLGVDETFLSGRNGPCPLCPDGGKDRWRFTDHESAGMWVCNHCGTGDGFELLMRLHGWDFATCAKEVERIVGTVRAEVQNKPDPAIRINRIREGLIRTHPEVTAYLTNRGVRQSPALAAHPSLAYYDEGRRAGEYPAMVAGVKSPEGETVTLHVTYLQAGRKAPVRAPRKMLTPKGSLNGAAIRLYRPGEHMGVAEGIETALSAARLHRIPTWALVNTVLMESWQPPPEARAVTIFADHDRNYAGHKAAYTLAFRLVNAGLEVDVRVPEEWGDWNDVLLERQSAHPKAGATSE